MIALLDPQPVNSEVKTKFDKRLFYKVVESYELLFALESVEELPSQKESNELYTPATEEEIQQWVDKLLDR